MQSSHGMQPRGRYPDSNQAMRAQMNYGSPPAQPPFYPQPPIQQLLTGQSAQSVRGIYYPQAPQQPWESKVEVSKEIEAKGLDEPVIPIEQGIADRPGGELDFSEEENVLKFVHPNRWLAIDIGGFKLLRVNWVVFILASAVLWGFTAFVLASSDGAATAEFGKWQTWVSQNFTWLYIGSTNIWIGVVIYLFFSKYGGLKLGKQHETPKLDDLSWFSMLFACGIGTGLYYWSVAEPLSYYRQGGGNAMNKPFFNNDSQLAQQSMMITFFHWGVHPWCVYIIVALILGFVCFRWNMPMTVRSAFFPLIGNTIFGPLGDVIDAVSIACTTFGVCTSLGLGVQSMNQGFSRLNSDIPSDSVAVQVASIWIITAVATMSVATGLHGGMKTLSVVTFTIGCFLIIMLLLLDNTWFLLNALVQNIGFYFQYILSVGTMTDTWEQLRLERVGNNLLWGAGPNQLKNPVEDAVGRPFADPYDYYKSHEAKFMEWWTMFYWGWWISWAPFVGMFVAIISRGRTIRQVIGGAIVAPVLFTFLWLTIFGSLGIKMQRTAELALHVQPDLLSGYTNCTAMGYDGGQPVGKDALALADIGIYALSCRSTNNKIFDVVMPYGKALGGFMHVLIVVGVILYFVTSSDSGSYVDDTLAAGGLVNPPLPQKIYWCFTEGATACALVVAGGGSALSALQAVSICAGLPYNIAISLMCVSLLRACAYDMGDETIMTSTIFNTGIFDWCDGLRPDKPPASAPIFNVRLQSLATSLFAPCVPMHKVFVDAFGARWGPVNTVTSAIFFLLWIALLITETGVRNVSGLAWTFYICFVVHMAITRAQFRRPRKIYGSLAEDFMTCLILFPCAASQMALHLATGRAPTVPYGPMDQTAPQKGAPSSSSGSTSNLKKRSLVNSTSEV